MRILTALRRGREAMATRTFAAGALFEMKDGAMLGGTSFEDVKEIKGMRPKVVGVCALGALYLGLVESKKSFAMLEDLVPDAAKALAMGILLTSKDRYGDAWEDEVAYQAGYIARKRNPDRYGYVEPIEADYKMARAKYPYEDWCIDSIDNGSFRPLEIIPEFNDDEGSKESIIAAFDAAILYAGRCGL